MKQKDKDTCSENGRAEFVTAMTDLTHFMSRQQWHFVKQLACGEEKQFFYDKMVELANLVSGMPQTYDQDGAGDNAFAYLHYFSGGCDWYITEKDKGSDDDEPQDRGKQHQAFGLADLGYGPELGYISIQELLDNNVELDFHFSPKSIAEIKGRDPVVAVTADTLSVLAMLAPFMVSALQSDGTRLHGEGGTLCSRVSSETRRKKTP